MILNEVWRKRPIILLGAGQLGQMALRLWPRLLNQPVMFLDESRTGSIDGVPIEKTNEHNFSSDNLYVLSFFKDNALNVLKLFEEVIKQEIITVYDLLTSFVPDEFSNGWMGDELNYIEAVSVIQIFNDEYSKFVYDSAVDWRYKRFLNHNYPVSAEDYKYNLKKYQISNMNFDLVIDGGAYDLSFSKYLIASGISWKKYIAFEPDFNRIEILKNLITNYPITEKKNLHILDSRALWTDDYGCMFYSNGQLSARVANNPNDKCVKIETISLINILKSNLLKKNAKILIKLHVEGAEWPVIQSLLPHFSKYSGLNFLINLSHDENSFIKIPRALSETNMFELYIDSHSLFGEGLTLFAKNKSI